MVERINLVPRKPLSSKLKGKPPFIIFFMLVLVIAAIQGQKLILEKKRARIINTTHKLELSIDNHAKLMARYAKQKEELTRLEEEHSAIVSRVSRLEGLQQQKRNFSSLIEMISETMPSSVIFKKISFNGNSGVFFGEARGYEDLPDFVETLKSNGSFATISLTGINRATRDGEMIFEFVLTGELIRSTRDKTL